MPGQYGFVRNAVVAGRLVAVFADGSTEDRGPAPASPGSLPSEFAADLAQAKADAAAAKAATDALAAHDDANDALDATQGVALTGNALRLVALEEGRVSDGAILVDHESRLDLVQGALDDDNDALIALASRVEDLEEAPAPANAAAGITFDPTVVERAEQSEDLKPTSDEATSVQSMIDYLRWRTPAFMPGGVLDNEGKMLSLGQVLAKPIALDSAGFIYVNPAPYTFPEPPTNSTVEFEFLVDGIAKPISFPVFFGAVEKATVLNIFTGEAAFSVDADGHIVVASSKVVDFTNSGVDGHGALGLTTVFLFQPTAVRVETFTQKIGHNGKLLSATLGGFVPKLTTTTLIQGRFVGDVVLQPLVAPISFDVFYDDGGATLTVADGLQGSDIADSLSQQAANAGLNGISFGLRPTGKLDVGVSSGTYQFVDTTPDTLALLGLYDGVFIQASTDSKPMRSTQMAHAGKPLDHVLSNLSAATQPSIVGPRIVYVADDETAGSEIARVHALQVTQGSGDFYIDADFGFEWFDVDASSGNVSLKEGWESVPVGEKRTCVVRYEASDGTVSLTVLITVRKVLFGGGVP